MSDMDPPENFRALDDNINAIFDELFDYNQRVFAALRQNITRIEVTRDAYLLMAEKCEDIINQLVLAGQMTAKQSGDLLMSQFDVQDADFGDDDDEED